MRGGVWVSLYSRDRRSRIRRRGLMLSWHPTSCLIVPLEASPWRDHVAHECP